jgi:hypothetical protein
MHVYVMPIDEKWAVKREGSEEIVSSHDRKKDALEVAKELAMGTEAELVILRKDGTIDNTGIYSVDPMPSPDRAPDYNEETDEEYKEAE